MSINGNFSKKQWEKAKAIKGVMIQITIRHWNGNAQEVSGVFETAGAQHDTCASAQRVLLRLKESK